MIGVCVKEYSRKYPEFSLCGLNCSLCPRFQTEGPSKCPGCGGKCFYEKHPTCSVITCSQKHNGVEFCYDCEEFPCIKYDIPMKQDTFISKKNFINDMKVAKNSISKYLDELKAKQNILEDLIKNFNDGRMKSYYCLAVNLIPLSGLKKVIDNIQRTAEKERIEVKEKAKMARDFLEKEAKSLGIIIELRK